jgi:16S rRNA (uracil1498-N3)-methyltransferase
MSRTTRIHVDAALVPGGEIRLGEQAARHVSRVLRLRQGDGISVFDGRGNEHDGAIASVRGADVRISVGRAVDTCPESPVAILLLQGISRGERMDLVVQKTTELGVTGIQPVFTRRSVVRLEGERARRRAEHWRGVAIAACEQCGRASLPDVRPPRTLEDALDACGPAIDRLLLDARAETALTAARVAGDEIALLTGPEGGLTAAERQAAMESGFTPVSLGPRIMRTETAAVVAVALIQSRWGDLRPSGL